MSKEKQSSKAKLWKSYLKGFEAYNMLERGLSKNSIDAYNRDIQKLKKWCLDHSDDLIPENLQYSQLQEFVVSINEQGIGAKSQARIISGIRSFYKYLLLEDIVADDPSELLEGPKFKKTVPSVLTLQEVEDILNEIDLSHPQGHRNRAILETLYACGLRVSELVDLKVSNYFPDISLIKVIGKNNKERVVPIGRNAIKYIDIYIHRIRNKMNIDSSDVDILFLNRRGKQLNRVMIFIIIKDLVKRVGIQKKVSPHTFRHSFATHLVEGGADLKAVQDMLGHESITTTEIYTHLDNMYLRDTILQFHPRNC